MGKQWHTMVNKSSVASYESVVGELQEIYLSKSSQWTEVWMSTTASGNQVEFGLRLAQQGDLVGLPSYWRAPLQAGSVLKDPAVNEH